MKFPIDNDGLYVMDKIAETFGSEFHFQPRLNGVTFSFPCFFDTDTGELLSPYMADGKSYDFHVDVHNIESWHKYHGDITLLIYKWDC